MLGVEEHHASPVAEEGDGLADHVETLFEGSAQGLGDVTVPGLAHDADVIGLGGEQCLQLGVVGHGASGTPSRAECDQLRPLQIELAPGPGEEFVVLGVGPGPTSLHEMDAELVEEVDDTQFLAHRRREALGLGSVPECGVVDLCCLAHVSSWQ